MRAGWVTWRFKPGQPRIIVAIKATLELLDGDACRFASEPRFITGDEFWDDDPDRTVRYDSDLALIKPQGELWITGTLHTENEVTERLCSVRVGPLRTRFAVVGDRFREPNGSVTPPRPFTSMPLCWEACFGGPGFMQNPAGRGLQADSDGRIPLPNIENPERILRAPSDRPTPPSFLPVPRIWAERAKLMGTYDRSYVKEHWPYFPDDFVWSHFQAARPEMRLPRGYWRGDEEVELHNLDPHAPILRSRLPGVRPRVFLHGTDNSFVEVGTVLDTVIVEADGPTLYCVWRGSAAIQSERLDGLEHLYLAHEPLDAPTATRAHREAFDAALARERAEDTALEGVEPPPLASPEGEMTPEVTNESELEHPPFEDPLTGLRATAAAEGAPREVLDQLATRPAPPAGEQADAVRAALIAAVAKARELGAHSTADALEGDEGNIELPAEPAVPSEPRSLKPEELRHEVQRRLLHGEPLSNLLLASADLSALDFTGRDLTNSVFAECDLRGAIFDEARLDGAMLDGAQLDSASFRKASLKRVSLGGASGAAVDFSGAVLEDGFGSGATLPKASFIAVSAPRLELSRSQLEGASFDGALLEGADLSDSNVCDASFTKANLHGLHLHGASARGANFDHTMLAKVRASGADLSGASLRWCEASEAIFARAVLKGARFTESDLTRATFAEAQLDDGELLAIRARGASFADASLKGARLLGADLLGARFAGASLMEADFRNANLFRAELWRTDARGALFQGANLEGTKLA